MKARRPKRKRVKVECLACGARRTVTLGALTEFEACHACGYVGWARPSDLSAGERRELREELVVGGGDDRSSARWGRRRRGEPVF